MHYLKCFLRMKNSDLQISFDGLLYPYLPTLQKVLQEAEIESLSNFFISHSVHVLKSKPSSLLPQIFRIAMFERHWRKVIESNVCFRA